MTRFVRTSFLLLASAALAAAADSAMFNMVMPDAKMVAGVNVSQALNSTFGRAMLANIQSDSGMDKFIAETGFDPRRDLTEVIVAGGGGPGVHGNGLVIAKGRFDLARIFAAIKSHGGAVTRYNGIDLVSKPDGKQDGAFAFLDASTMLAGSMDYVRSAIDRRSVGGGLDPKVLSKALDSSARNDLWFVTVSPVSDWSGSVPNVGPANTPLKGDMLKAVEQASGGIKFQPSTVLVQGEAVMRSDKDAQALADVFRFFQSMAQLNSSDPQAARIAAMLSGMQLTTASNVMKMSLTINQADLEQLMPKMNQQQQNRRPAPKKAAAVIRN